MYLKSPCHIEQIVSRNYQYMIHIIITCVNGDNIIIQSAKMIIVGLEKKLTQKEIFELKDEINQIPKKIYNSN